MNVTQDGSLNDEDPLATFVEPVSALNHCPGSPLHGVAF
jgi:hypothetical protein